MKKPAPVVDDADVEHLIHFMFGRSVNTTIAPEERADAAYQVALGISKVQQRTDAYAEALAQKVRARALWIKAPTGKIVETLD